MDQSRTFARALLMYTLLFILVSSALAGAATPELRNLAAESSYEFLGKHLPGSFETDDYKDTDPPSKLTDGRLAPWVGASYKDDNEFVGFLGDIGGGTTPRHVETITRFDLGGVYTVTTLRVSTYAYGAAGITMPSIITVAGSTNGTDWTEYVFHIVTDAQKDSERRWFDFTLSGDVQAQFIQLETYTEGARWFFMDEVEILGY